MPPIKTYEVAECILNERKKPTKTQLPARGSFLVLRTQAGGKQGDERSSREMVTKREESLSFLEENEV